MSGEDLLTWEAIFEQIGFRHEREAMSIFHHTGAILGLKDCLKRSSEYVSAQLGFVAKEDSEEALWSHLRAFANQHNARVRK